MNATPAESVHDPVCGIKVDAGTEARRTVYRDSPYVFCSERCAGRFDKDPSRYTGEPLIKMRSVEKTFGAGESTTRVLRGVDLNIWEGDFVSIVGASGSGKSTVLNLIGNLDQVTAGSILVRGRNIAAFSDEERARLRSGTFGFVFQQYNLIPWLSALENTLLPVIFAGKGRRTYEARMRERFTSIDLAHRIEHRPFQLSGGEQQRVALLRALANNPDVILGDEPTGNLDSKTGQKILEILRGLNAKEKKTLVIVTHDSSIARIADHTIVLKDGIVVREQADAGRVFAH